MPFVLVHVTVAEIKASLPYQPPVSAAVSFSMNKAEKPVKGKNIAGYKEFAELQFKFKIPVAPWREFRVRALDTSCVLGYVQPDRNLHFMIIAEKADVSGNGRFDEMLGGILRAINVNIMGMKTLFKEKLKINGVSGEQFEIRGVVAGRDVRYFTWYGARNGFFYGLIAWNFLDNPAEDLKLAFKKLSEGFEPLEAEAI